MAKVTFIGGGSAKFVAGLVRDLFSFEHLRSIEITLMDIDVQRMDRAARMVQKMIKDLKLSARVESTTDQRRALDGADYVIVTVMVGGLKHYESDGLIPVHYGLLPTVGDTIGPGAVMRLIRTAPVVAEIVKNLREVSPKAWVLNYTNPMAMLTGLFISSGHERTIGLCHSIQGAHLQIAGLLGIPADEVRFTAGGINHVNFYLTLTHKGKDLYPTLLSRKEALLAKQPELRVKFELLESIGGWPAEGEYHQSEYYPWFRKNRELAEQHYGLETMWGYHFDKKINAELDNVVESQIDGRQAIDYKRSLEYGAWIIDSISSNTVRLIYGNVLNQGLIPNLPSHAIVEVPCVSDGNGVMPGRVGPIPMALAAVMMPHVLFHQMAIQGVTHRDRRLLLQAIQIDPLTGAILTLPQIREMTEQLFAENAEYMKAWA